VQHACALRPDLVLMDVGLPGGMDGLEAAAHIRAQTAISIIYLTGSHESELHRPTGAAPLRFTIQKPVSDQALQQTIQLALATIDPDPPEHATPQGGSEVTTAFSSVTPEGAS
jgi:CheY-like chemotaxis protein